MSGSDGRSPLPDIETVRRAIQHQFKTHGHTIEAAMTVVLPLIRGRDEEIARLRKVLTDWVMTGKTSSEDEKRS